VSTQYNGRLADPEWRSERARKAALASHGPDALIAKLEARSEQLTAEHRARLAALAASA
jgi:hypothetical protein